MKKLAAILIAFSCSVQAQTFITVTADTNRVIRTNFSLVRAQVSDLSDAAFAISNITGLQSALDTKLATNGDAVALTNFPTLLLRTNGSALALTNFPAELLRTNGNAFALTNFPAELLRTNGSAAFLTNFPTLNQNTTGTASNVTGIVALANGGTGATNASEARTALELGTAATNDASAFQPANTNLTALATGDGSSLTNVTVTDASSLTNFPAELLRTNGSAAALTDFPSELLRTNGDGSGLSNVSVDLTTVLPSYSGNDGKVLAVATGGTNVEWTAVSNTVTDASALTNFPASLLTTNGDASALTNFPAVVLQTNSALTNFPAGLLRTNGDASGLTNLPATSGASATNIGQLALEFLSTNETGGIIWNTGAGATITKQPNGIVVQASLTNGSFARYNILMTAGLFLGQNTPLNFTNKFSFGAHLGVGSTNFAKANFRYFVGAETNAIVADPTNTMLGFRIKDQEIYAAMHNGTAYTEPFNTNGIFDASGISYVWCWVEGDGSGSVSWYVNGNLLGTSTNGPTNRAFGRYLSVSTTNDSGTNFSAVQPSRVLNFVFDFK